MLSLQSSGLYVSFEFPATAPARLNHLAARPAAESALARPETEAKWFRLAELQAAGFEQTDHHFSKHTGTRPGGDLRYVSHCEQRNVLGTKLEITQRADGIVELVSHYQFHDAAPVVRAWCELRNLGTAPLTVEYLSSLCLVGLAHDAGSDWARQCTLHVPHNTWHGEAQWRANSLHDLGLNRWQIYNMGFSTKKLSFDVRGSQSCDGLLPMGMLGDAVSGQTWFWQIEHNGSWHWELSTIANSLYLQLAGPTGDDAQWYKKLAPGESFTSVPVAIGCVEGGFNDAVAALTRYRRTLVIPHADHQQPAIIFNDYMNCLMGDPMEEKLLPLIDRAAAVGAEVFCIDAGWYADTFGGFEWWTEVGEWRPSQTRFPTLGLTGILDRIRAAGMVPGLWLEPEVMGVNCPLAKSWPDECFLLRHGQRVADNGRYLLDFRHPQVRAHVDATLDFMVNELGIGYLKMDYNVQAGVGTELAADSFGDGLLQHNRAVLAWLDGVRARHPSLILENCASGGQRQDWQMLARAQCNSSSDQTDWRRTPLIAANSFTCALPEQMAAWSYPLAGQDAETVAFNMVNALLGRIHLSGELAALEADKLALVKAALDLYRTYRCELRTAIPFLPLGPARFGAPWQALGLRLADGRALLAVWRFDTAEDYLDIPRVALGIAPDGDLRTLYPDPAHPGTGAGTAVVMGDTVRLHLPAPHTARLFGIG